MAFIGVECHLDTSANNENFETECRVAMGAIWKPFVTLRKFIEQKVTPPGVASRAREAPHEGPA